MDDEAPKRHRITYIPEVREYLKIYRYNAGYSAERLSRELDVSSVYYRQIEGGQRGKKLSVELVIALVIVLKVDALEFLKEEAKYQVKFAETNKLTRRNNIRWQKDHEEGIK